MIAVRGEPKLFLRNVTGGMRSPWTLPVVVVSGSSEEIQEHSAACNWCWTADCVLTFHLDTDAPLHE